MTDDKGDEISSNAIDANLTRFLPIAVPETDVISGVTDDKGDEISSNAIDANLICFLPIAVPETDVISGVTDDKGDESYSRFLAMQSMFPFYCRP